MNREPLCAVADIPLNSAKPIKAGGETLLVFHLEAGFFATQSQCTHLFAPLKRGKVIDGCQVECPLHRARFDIRTGEVVKWANFPPGIQLLNAVRKEKALKTWQITEQDGQLFLAD